ncbi:endoplasmic reticulum vesicle protein 25 [Cryptococcus floricola]|uniref:Endoplasmic reticulum vesicle protein 25 n=1 Tax=Cryptococcus floricola TaxID=2591691 RepID=A0A5D3AUZ4_9TREE|nr:endoplasmic reticulum vesicle protein 25 [Cryptococcus floricola]
MILRPSFLFLFLTSLLTAVSALKFDITADKDPKPKWSKSIWNFAASHSLVIVTANVPSEPDQRVDIEILDGSTHGNVYLNKKDIKGESRLAVTTHENADVGICLRNYWTGAGNPRAVRTVELDVDIGSDAVDYNAIANQESLSILEVEMRKLEASAREIVQEMGYLQKREMRMRDTNESTNGRVKWFSILIILATIGLGVWQLLHLRSFFKRKYLID